MLIYVKAGDREYITNPNYEYTLRDGHIIQMRWDETPGKAVGYSLIPIRVPVDFWDMRGTRDWKSTNAKVYDLKKYYHRGAYLEKYPWDDGYIDPSSVSTQFNKTRVRHCDWFIDFSDAAKWPDVIECADVFSAAHDRDRDRGCCFSG